MYKLVSKSDPHFFGGMTVFLSYDPDGEPQFGLIKSILIPD